MIRPRVSHRKQLNHSMAANSTYRKQSNRTPHHSMAANSTYVSVLWRYSCIGLHCVLSGCSSGRHIQPKTSYVSTRIPYLHETGCDGAWKKASQTYFTTGIYLAGKNVTVYALAKCRWTLSDPVEGKQWIRTLVSNVNVTTPYLSIKDNALLTVCRDAIVQ